MWPWCSAIAILVTRNIVLPALFHSHYMWDYMKIITLLWALLRSDSTLAAMESERLESRVCPRLNWFSSCVILAAFRVEKDAPAEEEQQEAQPPTPTPASPPSKKTPPELLPPLSTLSCGGILGDLLVHTWNNTWWEKKGL